MIVLVIGGNGFLGKHIVRLLLERESSVTEIRIFDLNAIDAIDNSNPEIPVVHIQGDILLSDQLEKACHNVGAIIHCAAFVSVTSDNDSIKKINVKGTENVISACIEYNISYLIYTSTMDVVIGKKDIIYGSEVLTNIPDKFLFGKYAESKYLAEKIVLEANKKQLKNGSFLRTLSLRPTIMYGEHDTHFITQALKRAKGSYGVIPRFGNGHSKSQFTYVGNAAWAHIIALKTIEHNEAASGEAYFITDDTPLINFFDFLDIFFQKCNLSISEMKIPFWFIYFLFSCIYFILSLLRLTNFYNKNFLPVNNVMYTCRTIFFNRMKARIMLDYKPLYTNEESIKHSLDWYKSIVL